MSSFTFDQIKQQHERAKAAGSPLGDYDLKGFASYMQQGDDQNDWSQGQLPDNMVSSVSRTIDKGFEATGLPTLTGNLGGGLGSFVDSMRGSDDRKYEGIGRDVGRDIPRMAAGAGLAIGGTLAAPVTGGGSLSAYAPAAGLLGLGAADAGIKAYSDSGSVGSGLFSAATVGLSPGISAIGSKLGGATLARVAPGLAANPVAKFVASEIGQESAFFGVGSAQTLAEGGNPLAPENLFGEVVGNLAFAPLTVTEGVRAARRRPASVPLAPLPPEQLAIKLADTGVASGTPFDVPVNDEGRLFQFLIGQADSATVDQFKSGNVQSALKLTGLIDPDLANAIEISNKRYKGREMVDELSNFSIKDKLEGGFEERKAALTRRAAKLLEVPGVELTEMVQRITALNAFERQFKEGKPKKQNQMTPLGFQTPASLKDSYADITARKPFEPLAFQGLDSRQANMKPLSFETPGDVSQNRRNVAESLTFKPLEFEQAPTGPKGFPRRPASVKGKVNPNALQERMSRPEYSRLDADEAPLNSEILRFTKGTINQSGGLVTRLGSTDIARNGTVNTGRFLKATQMPKEVFELTKQVYPEAFDGDTVNVHKLQELEKTRPMFETHVYGQGGVVGEAKITQDRMIGELDRLGIHTELAENGIEINRFRDRDGNDVDQDSDGLSPEVVRLMDDVIAHGYKADDTFGNGPRATSYYNQISPFDTTKYPVVRIDVTVPMKGEIPDPGTGYMGGPRVAEHALARQRAGELWRQDNLHENLPNTLGWAMVQFVPHPKTGETVMFVAEQQSRWGQDVASAKKTLKADKQASPEWHKLVRESDHPLLDHQHKLVLKAAMEEARKRGVTKMVVSDGESAMMTERHDTASVMDSPLPFNEGIGRDMIRHGIIDEEQVDYARRTGQFDFDSTPEEVQLIARIAKDNGVEWTGVQQPSQAGGMRQHYDKLLQSAAEKMTRSKGEDVDMGVHKNAKPEGELNREETTFMFRDEAEAHVANFGGTIVDSAGGWAVKNTQPAGSPVFRNPDGTPKATATGKMYSIAPDIVHNVRYSRLLDENGEVTSDSFTAQFEENLLRDGDPDRAMARLDLQLRAALKGKMKRANPETFQQGASERLSQAFDEMGIDPVAKVEYLTAVQEVIKRMDVPDIARFRTTDEMVKNGFMTPEEAAGSYGAYFEAIEHITVNPSNFQASKELGAFHAVKTLGHEAFHTLNALLDRKAALGIDDYRIKHLQQARDFANNATRAEREDMILAYQSALVPPAERARDLMMDNRFGATARYAASSGEEFMTEVAAMLSLSLARPRTIGDNIKEALRWAPQPIQDFANVFFRTFDEIKSLVARGSEALGMKPSRIQELNQFNDSLRAMLEPDPVVVQAKKDVQAAMEPFRVLGHEKSLFDAQWSKVDSPAVNEAVTEMRKANLFERRFGTLQQLVNTMRYKEAIPEGARVIDTLTTLGADIKKAENAMRSHLLVKGDGGLLSELSNTKDAKLTPKQIELKSNFGRVDASMPNRVAISEMYLTMNKLVAETPDNIDFNHPELQKSLEGMADADKAAIKAVFEAQIESNKNAAGMLKSSFLDRTILDVARIYKGAGLKQDDAMQTARVLMNSLFQGRMAPKELNGILGTDNAVNFWNTVQPAYQDLVGNLDRPHASELRTGRWRVSFETADGTSGKVGANTKQELEAVKREITKRGHRVKDTVDNQNKEFSEFDAIPTAMAESMLRLEKARFDSALDNLDPAVAEQLRSTYTLGQGIGEEINQRKQFMAERTFAPGREFIDMYANQGAYLEVVAASVTKKMARNQIAWEMESPNWDKDPGLRKEVETFAHDLLTTRNSSQLTNNIKKGALFTTMGANVSGALIDSSQALMVGAFKVAETLGVAGGFKAVAAGYKEAFNPKNVEFQEILTRAFNDGHLQTGATLDSIFHIDDAAGYNVSKVGDRRNLASFQDNLLDREFVAGKVFDQIKEYGGKVFNGAMIPTKASGQLNNKVMLYAGMVEGKALGLSGEALYRHATQVSQVTNFQGGRGAQSSFKTKFGQANNWVEAATLLTNYPISMISHMYGNYRNMLKSSGLPPAKRQRAAQIFAGQLTLQFSMAGSLGLGLGTLFKLTEKIFGFSPEEEVRKGLAEIDASGNLADIMLNGVANKATGVDLASRFSLGGVMGFNDYSGFDAKGIFGPSVTLWSGVAALPEDIKSGRLEKSGLIPNGIRKMIESTSENAFKDRSGQQLIEPSTTDRIMKFVGFNPDRLSKAQDQRSMYRFADEAVKKENAIKDTQRIEALNNGDYGKVLQSLQEDIGKKVAEWKARGMSPIEITQMREKELRSEALDLINKAVTKTMPVDPLSRGSGDSADRRMEIARSFGNSLTPRAATAEQQQLAARFLQGLGQEQVNRSPRSIRITQMADQLMAQDPTLTPQLAKQLAAQSIQ